MLHLSSLYDDMYDGTHDLTSRSVTVLILAAIEDHAIGIRTVINDIWQKAIEHRISFENGG